MSRYVFKHVKTCIQTTGLQTCINRFTNIYWRSLMTDVSPQLRTMSGTSSVVKVIDGVVKPDSDDRQYKGLLLNNGLKVLLISDPKTDISSASLEVNVGSMSEPKTVEGLAHFLEHMLFMGSKLYPQENEYSQFISRSGGHDNAYTQQTATNYHFDVSTEHLAPALHRFAQFFIEPLMTESATEREMKAVDSEFQRDRDMDEWRIYHLEVGLTDPEHDFNRFLIGNIESLRDNTAKAGIDVRKELFDFHDKWYSANIMGLVVLGKESIEELTEMTVPVFDGIKNLNVTPPEWTQHPLSDPYLRKQVVMVPISDIRKMNIVFPIPDLLQHYKSKPDDYITHLIGHEGPGSLLSELKARGLCNSLSAGGYREAKYFGFFNITVDLTVEGIEKTDEIITLLFQYINMIKKEGPQEWIFEENKSIKALHFKFREKMKPFFYTRKLASRIKEFPLEEVISGPSLMEEFRPDLINEVLDCLSPKKMNVVIVGKKFEAVTDTEEKWFAIKYKKTDIDQTVIDRWMNCGLNDKFSLPPKNQFIPRDLSLKPRQESSPTFPTMIKNSKMTRVWHLQDTKYDRPLANYRFLLTIPFIYSEPFSETACHMITRLMNDSLNESLYNPQLAGLNFRMCTEADSHCGLLLEFSGYNDKLSDFMSEILDKITHYKIDPKRFDVIKEEYFRVLKSHESEDLLYLVNYYTTWILSQRYWTVEELLQTETDLTVESVSQFMSRLFARFHAEGLIHGNITRDEALDVVNRFEGHFTQSRPISQSEQWRNRQIELSAGSNLLYELVNPIHQTNVIRVHIPIGVHDNDRDNCLLELFVQVIGEQFFNELRTKQQLGYVACATFSRLRGVQGLICLIQSDYAPSYLEERIEAFLAWTKEYLAGLSDEVFEKEKQSLLTRISETPKSMFAYTSKLWVEVDQKLYHFDRVQAKVNAIKQLTKQDVTQFYEQYVWHESPNRKKLSVRIASHKPSKVIDEEQSKTLYPSPALKSKAIDNVIRLRESSAIYALPNPRINIYDTNTNDN